MFFATHTTMWWRIGLDRQNSKGGPATALFFLLRFLEWTSAVHTLVDKIILGYILRYMNTTTVLFKTDKKLKVQAQQVAKRMGVPFSALLNNAMREIVEKQEATFSAKPLTPTPYLRRLLIQGEKDLKSGKNIKRFNSLEELMADLKN
jgi:addiction module RelB/DinJ family antitoxin